MVRQDQGSLFAEWVLRKTGVAREPSPNWGRLLKSFRQAFLSPCIIADVVIGDMGRGYPVFIVASRRQGPSARHRRRMDLDRVGGIFGDAEIDVSLLMVLATFLGPIRFGCQCSGVVPASQGSILQ